MAQQKQSKKSSPQQGSNYQALINRIYYANRLIKIYDICNFCDGLDKNSEAFKEYKAELVELQKKKLKAFEDDRFFDEGVAAEVKLQQAGVLDENSSLKNDDELLAIIRGKALHARDEQLASLRNLFADPRAEKDFADFLKKNSLGDLQKIIDNPKRGNAIKLRENMSADYAVYKATRKEHPLIAPNAASIESQIAAAGSIDIYAPENEKVNNELRKHFNTDENSKKKFLKMMGTLLGLGENLHHNPSIVDNAYYVRLRELSGNPSLSDETIRQTAKQAYTAVAEGLWFYKNQSANPDKNSSKENYIKTNISSWIKSLKLGKNDLPKLALLSPSEERDYKTANELRQDEIAKKHISIHHKIPEKYHAMLPDPTDRFTINDISNMEMVIGGILHDDLHKDDRKNMIRLYAEKDNGILRAPNGDMNPKHARRVSLDIPEPEPIAKLRPKPANAVAEVRTSPVWAKSADRTAS